jgi:hypothetical protein
MYGANNDAGEEEAVACDVCHIIRVRAADHSAAMQGLAIAARANRRALLRPDGRNSQKLETLSPS